MGGPVASSACLERREAVALAASAAVVGLW